MTRKNGIIIAIDGPTASGKSTTARLVAERLSYLHLNTGAMYRAFAFFAREKKVESGDEDAIRALLAEATIAFNPVGRVILNGRDVAKEIFQPEIATLASELSSIAAVREKLVGLQRQLGRDGGVVLEGRDIGTVVFPDAELKIFLVADPKVRAERRQEELVAAGTDISIEELEQQIADRDTRDQGRSLSPLRKATDAIELDTSKLTIDEQVEKVVNMATSHIA